MTRITPQEAREWHENAARNLENDIDPFYPWAHIHHQQIEQHRAIATLIQEMEEALRPFANQRCGNGMSDGMIVGLLGSAETAIKARDLRRAAVIFQTKNGDTQ